MEIVTWQGYTLPHFQKIVGSWKKGMSSTLQSLSSALGNHTVSGPSPIHCTRYWWPLPHFCSLTTWSMNHSSPLSMTTMPGCTCTLDGNKFGSFSVNGFIREAGICFREFGITIVYMEHVEMCQWLSKVCWTLAWIVQHSFGPYAGILSGNGMWRILLDHQFCNRPLLINVCFSAFPVSF